MNSNHASVISASGSWFCPQETNTYNLVPRPRNSFALSNFKQLLHLLMSSLYPNEVTFLRSPWHNKTFTPWSLSSECPSHYWGHLKARPLQCGVWWAAASLSLDTHFLWMTHKQTARKPRTQSLWSTLSTAAHSFPLGLGTFPSREGNSWVLHFLPQLVLAGLQHWLMVSEGPHDWHFLWAASSRGSESRAGPLV